MAERSDGVRSPYVLSSCCFKSCLLCRWFLYFQVRIKFMQRVLIPRLPAEKMKNTLTVRGDDRVEKCRNKVCEDLHAFAPRPRTVNE